MENLRFEEVKDKVKAIITNDLDVNIDAADIDDEVSLYDDGLGLDSIAIINLIVLVEKKFDISFDENEISAKLFSNINSLASFIGAKLAPKAEGVAG